MRAIRQQLTRRLLVGFGVPVVLGGLAIFVLMREALVRQFDAGLRTKAMAIATVTRQRTDRVDVDSSDRFMREFDEPEAREQEHPDDPTQGGDVAAPVVASAFFQVWRRDGATVDRSESLQRSDLPFPGEIASPRFWNLALPSGVAGRAFGFSFAPRMSREDRTRTEPIPVVLVVAADREALDRRLNVLAFLLLGGGMLLFLATSLVVPRVLRRELAPLDALADQAARIDADSLSARFPVAGLPSELVPIGRRLNDLLARLEQSFERERQFSADLAHELRTPIAELRSLAELALKWPDARDVTTDREALNIAVQMEHIVTRLMELLRSERGQLRISKERVSLDGMLRSVWQPFAERAAGRHLRVTWDIPTDADVETNPVLLRSILTNLIENAVEYTPEHGTVRVEANATTGQFAVRVTNDVDELSADDLPKLFDRFWRADPARAGHEHSGLGLSIGRAFAHALGCELTAALEEHARLTLTLSANEPQAAAV